MWVQTAEYVGGNRLSAEPDNVTIVEHREATGDEPRRHCRVVIGHDVLYLHWFEEESV